MESNITVIQDGGWTKLTLNRPSKRNAITGDMFQSIKDLFESISSEDTNGVTIRGAGENFSAGVDVSGVPEWAEMDPLDVRNQLESIHDSLRSIEAVDVPVVAALEGHVLGGGIELALASDIRIASRTAKFGLPESKMGLAMDLGGPQKLPSFIGEGLTKYLIMTGETIGADRAYAIGLVEELHDAEDFAFAVSDIEESLAEKPSYIHGLAKRQVHSARSANLDESMQRAIYHAIAAYQQQETQRRVSDFLSE
jgi:enoyl-CoA hydratase/carnithine racemase